MGTSKTDKFNSQQNQVATYAKAIGHPARVSILEYLASAESCICGDIVHEVGLSQSTVSQHLKELKTLGLIQGNIEGTKICYCINQEKLNEMKLVLNHFLNQIIHTTQPQCGQDDNCC